jgi:hypothetical protein
MIIDPNDQEMAAEAKAIVALAFRNGPIEDLHSGKPCPTCSSEAGYSRVTDEEMKQIMKAAVNSVYTLLRQKRSDPEKYAKQIAFGSRYARAWDEAEEVGLNGSIRLT